MNSLKIQFQIMGEAELVYPCRRQDEQGHKYQITTSEQKAPDRSTTGPLQFPLLSLGLEQPEPGNLQRDAFWTTGLALNSVPHRATSTFDFQCTLGGFERASGGM